MKYDWSKAPSRATSAVRDEDGDAYWVCLIKTNRCWVEDFLDMDPSAILDDSCDWRDSLELRPVANEEASKGEPEVDYPRRLSDEFI
jgi:hypothetical protein